MTTINIVLQNFKIVLSRRKYLLFTGIGFMIFIFLGFYFFDYELSVGNLGYFWTYADIISHIGISLLFALFLAGQIYKMRHVGKINAKTTGTGVFGSLFGIIITGCPSCSITLASYLGLAGFFSLLPRGGLEIKILSLVLMIYVNYRLYRDLLVCKLKNR